jgi:hypothetical protein
MLLTRMILGAIMGYLLRQIVEMIKQETENK